MLGGHCIKTWSATQHAYALSSAEAELYGMVEGVTRAKGLMTLAHEIGYTGLSNVVKLGVDSSAAKSFVCRHGLGRMRHLHIRDLWLQKEIEDGLLEVHKVPGEENPADLMTKTLGYRDIASRLWRMNLRPEGTEVRKSTEQGKAQKSRNQVREHVFRSNTGINEQCDEGDGDVCTADCSELAKIALHGNDRVMRKVVGKHWDDVEDDEGKLGIWEF